MILAISAHTGTIIGSNVGLAIYLVGILWYERKRKDSDN